VKTQPITPARIEWDAEGPPRAPDFGDLYHPRIGALAQARHVFLGGNGLPQRWAGRERFVVMETGFGLGNNFLATWDAWRQDPARCERLVFVGIERHPPTPADLARAHASSPLPALAAELVAAWPPLTPDIHALDFEAGRLQLLLAWGDIHRVLPELSLRADAFFLDGFAPARNPAMWHARILKALGRRAAPGATAATWSVARELRAGLTAAGFEIDLARGIGGKREITVAHHAPRFEPRIAARLAAAAAVRPPARREALVVGAGLAGAFTAQALAAQGWAVTVLDRQTAPAQETSGNVAGLFHGTVHGDDGPHARLLRAAALQAARSLRPLIDSGAVPGQLRGLLRLETRGLAAMQALIERQALPADWVQALGAEAAGALAGVTLPGAAWFFPGGGWVDPAALVTRLLQTADIRFVGGRSVHNLAPADGGWQALDSEGRTIAQAPVAVLANAADSQRLLAPFGLRLPLQTVRGQVSGWQGADTPLALPVAGDGYALPLAGGGLLCGATSANDPDPALRHGDHLDNFERLQRLTGLLPPPDPTCWQGRVGWRLLADDRQPVAGAVPLPTVADRGRRDQARLWPRLPGLYLCTALGGRGITLAPLLGRLLAAQIAGSPLPLGQSLVDAIDPARWLVRAARQSSQAGQG
jgi:tRNA 5-methylaminomethyl-2-thiouridine biosynthesis bifunctional protein